MASRGRCFPETTGEISGQWTIEQVLQLSMSCRLLSFDLSGCFIVLCTYSALWLAVVQWRGVCVCVCVCVFITVTLLAFSTLICSSFTVSLFFSRKPSHWYSTCATTAWHSWWTITARTFHWDCSRSLISNGELQTPPLTFFITFLQALTNNPLKNVHFHVVLGIGYIYMVNVFISWFKVTLREPLGKPYSLHRCSKNPIFFLIYQH